MSIWGKLLGAGAGLALGGPLGALAGAVAGHALIDRPRRLRNDPQARQIAFTIAVVALAAKMARTAGTPAGAAFAAFRHMFHIEPGEEAHVARFFTFAHGSTAGYPAYARQIAGLFRTEPEVLGDLLEALRFVAEADGPLSPDEAAFLAQVGRLFGLAEAAVDRIVGPAGASEPDPWQVLELPRTASAGEIRMAYRRLAMTHHPDRLQAKGVPPEFIRVAEARMAAINAAYNSLLRAPEARS